MTHQCSSPCSKELRDIGDCVCDHLNQMRLSDEGGCVMLFESEATHVEKLARYNTGRGRKAEDIR